jgi:Uncharacterized protein conserved in bacteria (DUF2252)
LIHSFTPRVKGVDDFDESYPLPYTNDIVRLAASLKIVSMPVDYPSGLRTDAVPSWTDICNHCARAHVRSSSPNENKSWTNYERTASSRLPTFGGS